MGEAFVDVEGALVVAVAEEDCTIVGLHHTDRMQMQCSDHKADVQEWSPHLCHTHALPFPMNKPLLAS